MAKAATLEVKMGPIRNRGLDEDFIPLSGWTADIEVLKVASYKEEKGQPTGIG